MKKNKFVLKTKGGKYLTQIKECDPDDAYEINKARRSYNIEKAYKFDSKEEAFKYKHLAGKLSEIVSLEEEIKPKPRFYYKP